MNIRIQTVSLVFLIVASRASCADPFSGIRPERELFITHPKVVDDARAKYPGPWSFGGLVNELVGEEKAGACVRAWLETWVSQQTVNGFDVPARSGIMAKVIEPWRKRDGFDPKSGQPWMPKLENAPFRLLAIVNRMDLCASQVADVLGHTRAQWKAEGKLPVFEALLDRATQSATVPNDKTRRKITVPTLAILNPALFDPRTGIKRQPVNVCSPYGFRGGPVEQEPDFGEGRFVFGAVDEKGQPLAGGWTVIFEYTLPGMKEPKKSATTKDKPGAKDNVPAPVRRRTLREWATQWHMLSFEEPGTGVFNDRLENLTRHFTHRAPSNDVPPLGQLRTSEAAFGAGREFRQFALDQDILKLTPLAQTPAPDFAKKDGPETRVLAEFLREGAPLIRSGVHVIPAALQLRNETAPVLGGNAIIPAENPAFQWNPKQGVPAVVRRVFSLNTCTGCHAGETDCAGLHVSPRPEGSFAVLSSFLRMDGQPLHAFDKASAQKVEFREMEERAAIFAALLDRTDTKRMEDLRSVLRERIGRSH
jgi:hypothetical protein